MPHSEIGFAGTGALSPGLDQWNLCLTRLYCGYEGDIFVAVEVERGMKYNEMQKLGKRLRTMEPEKLEALFAELVAKGERVYVEARPPVSEQGRMT